MSDGPAVKTIGSLGSTGGVVLLATTGRPVVSLEVSGPFAQTLVVEETLDGQHWVTPPGPAPRPR